MTLPSKRNGDIFKTVVDNGYCIGCGVCAAFDSSIRIQLNPHGCYVATRTHEDQPLQAVTARVCPFNNGNPNEEELGRELFGDAKSFDPHIGSNLASYAGWVVESNFRAQGSSGGVASWVLVELFEREMVDYVVHVAPQSVTTNGGGCSGLRFRPMLVRFALRQNPDTIRLKCLESSPRCFSVPVAMRWWGFPVS